MLINNHKYWRDLDFPIVIRTTGTGIPILATLQGNIKAPQWAVNDFNDCEGQELPHDWIEGTTLQFHAHLITNGTDLNNQKYIKFTVEYCFADRNNALSAAQILTMDDFEIGAQTPDKTHLFVPIGSLALTTEHIGCHIYCQLKRVAAVGDPPAANPWVTMLQAHIETDGLGSSRVSAK